MWSVREIRMWLIKLLAGKTTVVLNLYLKGTLYVDTPKCQNGYFYNVCIEPETVGDPAFRFSNGEIEDT